MKASQLIKKLEAVIELYGDTEVTYYCDDGSPESPKVETVEPWAGDAYASPEKPIQTVHLG